MEAQRRAIPPPVGYVGLLDRNDHQCYLMQRESEGVLHTYKYIQVRLYYLARSFCAESECSLCGCVDSVRVL